MYFSLFYLIIIDNQKNEKEKMLHPNCRCFLARVLSDPFQRVRTAMDDSGRNKTEAVHGEQVVE